MGDLGMENTSYILSVRELKEYLNEKLGINLDIFPDDELVGYYVSKEVYYSVKKMHNEKDALIIDLNRNDLLQEMEEK